MTDDTSDAAQTKPAPAKSRGQFTLPGSLLIMCAVYPGLVAGNIWWSGGAWDNEAAMRILAAFALPLLMAETVAVAYSARAAEILGPRHMVFR